MHSTSLYCTKLLFATNGQPRLPQSCHPPYKLTPQMQERCTQSACHQICVAGIQKFRKSWPKMLRWYPARPPPTVWVQGVGIGGTIAPSTNPNIASSKLPPKNFLEPPLICSWLLNQNTVAHVLRLLYFRHRIKPLLRPSTNANLCFLKFDLTNCSWEIFAKVAKWVL